MTDVSSEIMQSGNLEDEFRYPVNNTYVIQSSDGVESIEVPDKPSMCTSNILYYTVHFHILI